ncbi:MAG TPA: CHAT domain-containing protein, partial [Chthonomonadales bacterium]|nr:CHAT domain-containing protein [Chthonomonadales bacterium]
SAPPLAGPVRVLIACADPDTPRYPRLPYLHDELAHIRESLQPWGEAGSSHANHPKIEVLQNCDKRRLRATLARFRPHLFHFMGHGDLGATGGFLVLEGDREGAEERVYGEELAEMVASCGARLAVLSACFSGKGTGALAQQIMDAGVPATLSTQSAWRDSSSALFSGAFYDRLFNGKSVEEAVSFGRQAVRGMGPDWSVPVLYLSADSSDLFPIEPSHRAPGPSNLSLPPNPHFIGRAAEMEELRARMELQPAARVAVTGLGGAGKTQLAAEYAHRHCKLYPGGIFWIDGRTAFSDLASLASLLDIPEEADERIEKVRDRLHRLSQPYLIILDNLTDSDTLRLLPALGVGRVLVTTIMPFLLPAGYGLLQLNELPPDAAVSLLTGDRPPETKEEKEAAKNIARTLGGLPLAITMASHQVRELDCSYVEYRRRLLQAPLGMLERAKSRFVADTRHQGSVYDVIDLGWRKIGLAAQRTLQVASCFGPHPLPLDVLQEACAGSSADEVADAVSDLCAYSLLRRNAGGAVTLHEVVRHFAHAMMGEAELRRCLMQTSSVLTHRVQAANASTRWSAVADLIPHGEAVLGLFETHSVRSGAEPLLMEAAEYLHQHDEYHSAIR